MSRRVQFGKTCRYQACLRQRLFCLRGGSGSLLFLALATSQFILLSLQAGFQIGFACRIGLVEEGLALRAHRLGIPREGIGRVLQGILDAFVEFGAEQRLQDGLALLRVGHQEFTELSLGQA